MLLCVLAAGVVAAGVVAFVLAHLWLLVGGAGVTVGVTAGVVRALYRPSVLVRCYRQPVAGQKNRGISVPRTVPVVARVRWPELPAVAPLAVEPARVVPGVVVAGERYGLAVSHTPTTNSVRAASTAAAGSMIDPS